MYQNISEVPTDKHHFEVAKNTARNLGQEHVLENDYGFPPADGQDVLQKLWENMADAMDENEAHRCVMDEFNNMLRMEGMQ